MDDEQMRVITLWSGVSTPAAKHSQLLDVLRALAMSVSVILALASCGEKPVHLTDEFVSTSPMSVPPGQTMERRGDGRGILGTEGSLAKIILFIDADEAGAGFPINLPLDESAVTLPPQAPFDMGFEFRGKRQPDGRLAIETMVEQAVVHNHTCCSQTFLKLRAEMRPGEYREFPVTENTHFNLDGSPVARLAIEFDTVRDLTINGDNAQPQHPDQAGPNAYGGGTNAVE